MVSVHCLWLSRLLILCWDTEASLLLWDWGLGFRVWTVVGGGAGISVPLESFGFLDHVSWLTWPVVWPDWSLGSGRQLAGGVCLAIGGVSIWGMASLCLGWGVGLGSVLSA